MTELAIALFRHFFNRVLVTEGAVFMIWKGHKSGIIFLYLVTKVAVQTENFSLVIVVHVDSAGKTLMNTPEIAGTDDDEQHYDTYDHNQVSSLEVGCFASSLFSHDSDPITSSEVVSCPQIK
jgi:hypothetical protein